MHGKIFEVSEGKSFGLEIRLDISQEELMRIRKGLLEYHDQEYPQVRIHEFDKGIVFGRTPEPSDNPNSVYFFATRDKDGVQSIVRAKGSFCEERKEVLKFEFVRGNMTPEYLGKFLGSLGYSDKAVLEEAQRKQANTALRRSLEPTGYREHAERPGHS